MNFLVGKILNLSSHKSETPEEDDLVDLGLDNFDQDSGARYLTSSNLGASYSNVQQTNRLKGQPSKEDFKTSNNNACTC